MPNNIKNVLTSLTGQLRAVKIEDETKLADLQKTIANALIHQDPVSIRSQEFAFERSDIYMPGNISDTKRSLIEKIADRAEKSPRTNADSLVFERSVAARIPQIQGGLTDAAFGTRATTVGPLLDISGRDIYYDIVKVRKLYGLYIQGQVLPAMLFNVTLSSLKRFNLNFKDFKLNPETVWINAKIFDPAAEEGFYCGLRIKGGSLSFSEIPNIESNRLSVQPAVTVTCHLDLEQKTDYATDPESPFGKDARNAAYNLPQKFKFSFAGNTKKILEVGEASWKVYGFEDSFTYINEQTCVFNPFVRCVAIPVKSGAGSFHVNECVSPFYTLEGSASIKSSWWGIPVAKINTATPPEADGSGMLIIECNQGLSMEWKELQGGQILLPQPFIIGEPGGIGLVELRSAGSGKYQQFGGWKDKINPFGTSMDWKLRKDALFMLHILAQGNEIILGVADCEVNTDRPVKVNGEAVTVRSKNSQYLISIDKEKRSISIGDNDMLWDNKLSADKIPVIKPYALAMHNALFTVTPPNSLFLFAQLSEDLKIMTGGKMYLGFGLYSYLPTLPDPYAANIGILKAQFYSRNLTHSGGELRDSVVWMWLLSMIEWKKGETDETDHHEVKVSFHFAPLQTHWEIQKANGTNTHTGQETVVSATGDGMFKNMALHMKQGQHEEELSIREESPARSVFVEAARNNLSDFALLDVSSKANQMGIAFSQQRNFLQKLVAPRYRIHATEERSAEIFPILIEGMDVVAEGKLAQAFTLPQIAWEPVFNLTEPHIGGDPPIGFNYYSSEGLASRIGNFNPEKVPLSPIPMSDYLVKSYRVKEDGKTYALFNLPFGMVAISIMDNNSGQAEKPEIDNIRPEFKNAVSGGIQLELTAGTSWAGGNSVEGNMFEGYTAQVININKPDGSNSDSSTLGNTVRESFNGEFLANSSNLSGRPAVPLTRIGLSGYGANIFSNWLNKDAAFSQTSQALFNVTMGRTSHEVVQIKSVLYPWGIRVVRTVTIFRLANGYVMRIDSGWKAESDGKFDFSYKKDDGTKMPQPYIIHPGLIHGLFNIRNIQEIDKVFEDGPNLKLQAVKFDADVKLENVVEGGQDDMVSSTGVLGYVQVLPQGSPIDENDFKALLEKENNTIGGPISCIIKVAGTDQRMKLDRVDVNNSTTEAIKPAFVAAVRGSVVLPKEGSWSLVQHTRGTGEVSPLPEHLSVPLIRKGAWIKDQVVSPNAGDELLRIAYPGDLLKVPDANTINFGFLQNLNSQKVLFLTPSYKTGLQSMLSKTPPLMADAFRVLNSKGIFPNIGDAENGFGSAMELLKGVGADNAPIGDVFKVVAGVTDQAKQVWEIMSVEAKTEAGKLVDQGYKLIKNKADAAVNDVIKFDLPSFDYPLIHIEKKLKIYVEYKATSKALGGEKAGKLDYNVDSFASTLADTWKGRMSNMAMVVDLGPFLRLMTIKGNFNAQKGQETDFGGGSGGNLPVPEIEFSKEFEPVIKILDILSELSTGKYGDALKKGLKIALSNSANVWEYKFEATKDIPMVRFPPEANLYESPQTPFKLEAGMAIGVYFNAALKVTTDAKQLLPTAGAFFKFHGGLQVMCVSVGVGTIYAVGSVELMVRADTSPLISLTMKFGFGAQVGVGLPVIGNVSILFMVGIEIYVDSNETVAVTAFLYFRGHAEIMGGLVGVTITIEARGTVTRQAKIEGEKTPPTFCTASVTFALDISIFLVIDINFKETWEESKQIA